MMFSLQQCVFISFIYLSSNHFKKENSISYCLCDVAPAYLHSPSCLLFQPPQLFLCSSSMASLFLPHDSFTWCFQIFSVALRTHCPPKFYSSLRQQFKYCVLTKDFSNIASSLPVKLVPVIMGSPKSLGFLFWHLSQAVIIPYVLLFVFLTRVPQGAGMCLFCFMLHPLCLAQ